MKLVISTILSSVLLLLISPPAGAAEITQAEIEKIIHDIDTLYRAESSHSMAEMEIVTPHWTRTLKMEVWTEGLEKTFVRILEPKKERGMATLRIEDEMWNYLPKTNKVIKIPPSMMMSSWMGSDFTNDDLVHEFSLFEDYDYYPAEVENPEPDLIYVKSVPHEDLPIVWGHIIIVATADDHMPVRQEYYDEKGNLMRVMKYSDIQPFDGRKLPSEMTMIPQDEEGQRTTFRYLSLEFNVDLEEDEVFSLRNLRSGF